MQEIGRVYIEKKPLIIYIEYCDPGEINEAFESNIAFESVTIPYIIIAYSNKTSKKTKTDKCDRLFHSKKALYDIYEIIKEWVLVKKPKEIYIGAHGDDIMDKRIDVYDWFLGKLGYENIFGYTRLVCEQGSFWVVRRVCS